MDAEAGTRIRCDGALPPPSTRSGLAVDLRVADLTDRAVVALVREHKADLVRHGPPGSGHALDIDALRRPGITILCARRGEPLAGLDASHGEIKSMRTHAAHIRTGVASALVRHLVAEARRRGYRRLSLETGATAPFAPAHALYAGPGFMRCAQSVEAVHRVCMTMVLPDGDARTAVPRAAVMRAAVLSGGRHARDRTTPRRPTARSRTTATRQRPAGIGGNAVRDPLARHGTRARNLLPHVGLRRGSLRPPARPCRRSSTARGANGESA